VQAQRIEQLADPGGVCITASIHDALSKRAPFDLENLGEQELKGFDDPVRVYRVELSAGESVPLAQQASKNKTLSSRPGLMVVAIVIALAITGGAAYWFNTQEPKVEAASIERMAFPLPDKPSIAVLPFINMSNDAEQEFFADGITEDLITDISQISGLFVIARNSVFTYKGKAVKIRQVAEELGVRYVLEGSVRRVGNQVRINAQLIDATTGGHIWAKRYDGSLDDVFSMQDKITQKIVVALSVTLGDQEPVKVDTNSPEAYDTYLRGWERYRLGTPEDLAKAVSYFKQAIELDPEFARAHSALAAAYMNIVRNLWYMKSLNISIPQAAELSRISLRKALEKPSALDHAVASERAALFRKQPDKALAEAEQAIALDANDPAGHLAMAGALIKAGRAVEAVESVRVAMRLDPHYPASYLTLLGQAQFAMEDYEKSVESLEIATSRNPDDDWSFVYLAAAYGQLGREKEGKKALEAANALRAKASWGALNFNTLRLLYFRWQGDIKPLREGLKIAGIKPEANWSALMSSTSGEAKDLQVKGATKIDVKMAKVLHERGVPFVDIYQIWWQKHIPGAHHLSWFYGEFNEASLGKIVSKNQEVVIYSSDSVGRTRGAQNCAKAVTYGFEKVYYLPEGSLSKWEKAGYPVETSKEYFLNQLD
jgi:TolB-like protein